MGAITHSIEVNAPLQRVYHQWTQFEEFPRFMEGVDEVRPVGLNQLFWKAKIGGIEKQWEAEISEQVPNERIAWQSVGGTPNRGAVTFEALDVSRTRVTLTMEYEAEGLLEKAGDVLGIPFSEVEGDLDRFREFMENGGSETGPRGSEIYKPQFVLLSKIAGRCGIAIWHCGSARSFCPWLVFLDLTRAT
jgi:uncharacterized membrane protein